MRKADVDMDQLIPFILVIIGIMLIVLLVVGIRNSAMSVANSTDSIIGGLF